MNIVAGPHNSTAVYVAWLPVPKEHRRGIIIAYRLDLYDHLHTLGKDINVPNGEEDKPQNVTVNGLHKYTKYIVHVTAKTSAGSSNAGYLHVTTSEDGK